MTETPTSAYDNFIFDSAKQYLSTVVLIDDRIYESKSGSVVSRLATPRKTRRKAALKTRESKTGKKSKSTQDSEDGASDEVSFHEIQNSFAKDCIICSLYQPQKNASFGEQSDVYKLCSTADVVIVDWDLHGDLGGKATQLVGSLVEQSRKEAPYQLRLVFIYTLNVNLQSVAGEIYDDLVKRLGADTVDVDLPTGGLVLTTDNARVVVLGKREGTSLLQFSDHWVPENMLATRTITEFSKLASGLLQGIILRGIANLRKNNRRILTRFNEDLDIAFLTHRALKMPEEAFGHIIPLLTDELRSVLEDTLGESPLGKASDTKDILGAWCDAHWTPSSKAKLKLGDADAKLTFAKDVFCNGPALEKEYSPDQNNRINPLIMKRDNDLPSWKKPKNIANYLSSGHEKEDCNKRLSALMSQRAIYNDSQRTLHLGAIVREMDGEKRYLLCLQPVCDSVRMGRKSRAFVLCALKEPGDGKPFTHCVMDGGSSVIKLEYTPKVSNISVSNFSGTDAVYAKKDGTDQFIFTDEDDNEYEWIAELKTEHAQRAAEKFGRELSRVGLTESEWLRLKAKG